MPRGVQGRRPNWRSARWPKFSGWKPSTSLRGSMRRSEEHTSELQSLMRISYDVFCFKKKIHKRLDRHLTSPLQHYHIPLPIISTQHPLTPALLSPQTLNAHIVCLLIT